MHDIHIRERIVTNCSQTVGGAAWLDQLPKAITDLKQRWSLTLSSPFEEEASCSWVAPCVRQDGTPAVLKFGLPHMEAANEIDGLLFWDGDPTVFVLEADFELNAILLDGTLRHNALSWSLHYANHPSSGSHQHPSPTYNVTYVDNDCTREDCGNCYDS